MDSYEYSPELPAETPAEYHIGDDDDLDMYGESLEEQHDYESAFDDINTGSINMTDPLRLSANQVSSDRMAQAEGYLEDLYNHLIRVMQPINMGHVHSTSHLQAQPGLVVIKGYLSDHWYALVDFILEHSSDSSDHQGSQILGSLSCRRVPQLDFLAEAPIGRVSVGEGSTLWRSLAVHFCASEDLWRLVRLVVLHFAFSTDPVLQVDEESRLSYCVLSEMENAEVGVTQWFRDGSVWDVHVASRFFKKPMAMWVQSAGLGVELRAVVDGSLDDPLAFSPHVLPPFATSSWLWFGHNVGWQILREAATFVAPTPKNAAPAPAVVAAPKVAAPVDGSDGVHSVHTPRVTRRLDYQLFTNGLSAVDPTPCVVGGSSESSDSDDTRRLKRALRLKAEKKMWGKGRRARSL